MNKVCLCAGLRDGDDEDGLDRGGRQQRVGGGGVRPHDLHVGVVLASEEMVAAVGSHHVFIHRELDLPPELAVFLRAHGQPGKIHPNARQHKN